VLRKLVGPQLQAAGGWTSGGDAQAQGAAVGFGFVTLGIFRWKVSFFRCHVFRFLTAIF